MQDSADLAALRLAAIVEFSDDAIVSKDLNGTIVTWNRAAERIFGFSAAEMIGKPITTIIPPDRLSEAQDVLARIRRGEVVDHYETVRLRKDGTPVSISLTVSPIRNEAGIIIGASKIARDISDRRRTERALEETLARQRDLQQRLVALVEASGSLFGSPKLDDVLASVIVLARTLLPADGYALWRLDSMANTWHIGASSGLSAEFTQRIIASYRGGGVSAVPFTEPLIAESVQAVRMLEGWRDVYLAEGIESILAVPLQVQETAAGTLVFYFRTAHRFDDVEVQTAQALSSLAAAAIGTAELYETQQRIREQAERTTRQAEYLAQASAALASSLDYETTLRTVANLAVPHVADWCAVDLVGERDAVRRVAVAHIDPKKVELARTIQEQYPEDPEHPSAATRVIRSGKPFMLAEIPDEVIENAARSPEHLAAIRALAITSFICVPLMAHGRILGTLTFVSAESGRRYTDDDLKFAQDVAYRSAIAVDNARSYAQVNAANRAKDEFLATLSHELRTPLNAVLGWIRMLRSGSVVPGKVGRALEVIERNAGAQLRLVEDLLDLSRIITGKFRLDVQPVHLSSSIDAAVAAILPAATAKKIALEVDADADAGPVHGDAQRLQQAVWNLLSNAIKFTPPGGRVNVALRRDASHAVVEVADSGEGIAPEVLPYVFDRFRQGDSGSTRAHMGLGLGLAIVRHIVELHGGQVNVRSEGIGRGATFRIALPAITSVPRASDGRQSQTGASAPEIPLELGRAVAGLHVLVVDDDADAIDLLEEVLRQQGVTVRRAESVDEAFAAIEREVPDVVVSDIAMPGRDGYDLIQRLRDWAAAARRAAIPVVALSAYARSEDRQRSLAAGFSAHLAKPVDLPDLLNAILDATGRTQRAD